MDSADPSQIDPALLTELSALADGTLAPERRAEAEQRMASSAQLKELYEHERRALTALREVAGAERAPARLRELIDAERPRAKALARRRTVYAGSLASALAAVALVLALVLPAGAPGAPSVSEAAALAVRGSASAAPAPDPRSPQTRLTQNVQHVYFPNWSIALGWAAVGQRIDHIAGRRVVTVYYQGHGTTVAYTIVSGSALAKPGGASISNVGGVWLRTLSLEGRLVVTWRRAGHTCVLSGMGLTASELQQLAGSAYPPRPKN
jgi:anti-sigma factor RsiW